MSDEASSSAAAADTHDTRNDRRQDAPPSAADVAKKRKKNRQMFNKKRGELLDELLRSLDILVYAELSAIYYMDCSFLRLFLRAVVQFLFLTPKPTIFPEAPQNRPYIGIIGGTNILCLILHIWLAAPSAGEPTRGYLHGGLAMDFIGQQGPTNKFHLILLDLLVLLLQLMHLSAHITRQRLKEGSLSVTTPSGRQYTPAAPATTRQDLDSEERGVRRSGEQQDIEMQTLNPSGAAPVHAPSVEDASSDVPEREALLESTTARTDAHIFDAFNSGQIVLADLAIVQTVKEQFWAYQNSPREPAVSGTELRRNVIGQLLRWRSGATVGAPAQRG